MTEGGSLVSRFDRVLPTGMRGFSDDAGSVRGSIHPKRRRANKVRRLGHQDCPYGVGPDRVVATVKGHGVTC